MSPHRQLSVSSRRHPTQIQEIFLGLGLQLHDSPPPNHSPSSDARDMEYAFVLHDGTGIVENETFHHAFPSKEATEDELQQASVEFSRVVLKRINELQAKKGMDVRVVAGAQPVPEVLQGAKGVEWMASVWLHLDAIPFLISPPTTMFKRLPTPSTQASAGSAISAALKYLHPATHSATLADTDSKDHHVLVDCDQKVRLGSLLQYEQSTSPELWRRFTALSRHLLSQPPTTRLSASANPLRGISVSFFSATPQGGGVALMRHALIRLWRMIGLDVQWYVPEGHPAIFDITKRKIHNVLQGVAEEGVEMDKEDKGWFETWTEENYIGGLEGGAGMEKSYEEWRLGRLYEESGPLIADVEAFWNDGAINADVIVIDDPQLTALIPIIKKKRPDAKIIFRSHIQIQADLTDKEGTPQYRTWNYLFNFVRHCDLFLAHPVRQFVPKNVNETLPVLYMPPSTDPLDGLNKPYGKSSVQYFRQYFNQLSSQQGGNRIGWDRGYICQVARFDPSKGINHLLEAYLQFRQKLDGLEDGDQHKPADGGQQLIIMGHGSQDDPDGTHIFEQCHEILAKDEYRLVKEDVAVVRAPPSDSVLGCIMQGAWVATQLSTREGFEVKVTEIVNKRVPVIASDAGGIPLQVKHGVNGWIVPSGDARAVSDLLFDIHTGTATLSRAPPPSSLSLDGATDPNSIAEAFVRDVERPMARIYAKSDKGSTSEDFWTIGNAVKWMYLFSKVLQLDHRYGDEVKQDVEGVMARAEGLGEGTKGRDAIHGKEHWLEVLKRDERVLEQMGIGQKGDWADENWKEARRGQAKGKSLGEDCVWRLVMGQDLVEGEGEVRDHQ